MGWVIGLAVTLQLILFFTCALALFLFSERDYAFSLPDEYLLYLLTWLKVIAGPVSLALLAFKQRLGMKFTGVLFLVYVAGSAAMPFMATNPMAFWYNTRWMGQGLMFALAYLFLGVILLKADRLQAGSAESTAET